MVKASYKRISLKGLASAQWKTISKKDRKNLGMTKKSFTREFYKEMRYIRSKRGR